MWPIFQYPTSMWGITVCLQIKPLFQSEYRMWSDMIKSTSSQWNRDHESLTRRQNHSQIIKNNHRLRILKYKYIYQYISKHECVEEWPLEWRQKWPSEDQRQWRERDGSRADKFKSHRFIISTKNSQFTHCVALGPFGIANGNKKTQRNI